MNPLPGWLPIYYREATEIPRAFVVKFDGDSYFFDCPFNEQRDDFDDFFSVYRVPDDLVITVDDISLSDLGDQSVPVGRVSTKVVVFDPSKRQSIHRRVFQFIDIESDG